MSEHAPVLHLKSSELRPHVRAYAESLSAQILDIFRAARVRTLEEWEAWLADERRAKRITAADAEAKLVRLKRLFVLLRETAQTGKKARDERERLAYDFDIEEYIQGVRKLGELWNVISGGLIHTFDTAQGTFRNRRIEDSIAGELSKIPLEAFEDDETIGQKILEALQDTMLTKIGWRPDIGFLWSKVMNYSLGSLDPEDLEGVRQKIHSTIADLSFLAWEWPGGTVEVTGPVGKHFAAHQKGGHIRAETVSDFAGLKRSGGSLSVTGAGHSFCACQTGGIARAAVVLDVAAFEIEGGEVEVGVAGRDAGKGLMDGTLRVTIRAGDDLGQRQEGGLIIAAAAGKRAGFRQLSGALEVVEAGSYLGQEQEDGVIRAKKAGSLAGHSRLGGKLEVEEADNGFCSYMKGGEARAILTGDEAGYKQEGGRIEVDEAAGTVAIHQAGGEFVVNKDCAKIATNRTGGTVIYRGKKVV